MYSVLCRFATENVDGLSKSDISVALIPSQAINEMPPSLYISYYIKITKINELAFSFQS